MSQQFVYLQVDQVVDDTEAEAVRRIAQGLGSVVGFGFGTACSEAAAWLVVRCRAQTVSEVRSQLTGLCADWTARVSWIGLAPSEGAAKSFRKQLPLWA